MGGTGESAGEERKSGLQKLRSLPVRSKYAVPVYATLQHCMRPFRGVAEGFERISLFVYRVIGVFDGAIWLGSSAQHGGVAPAAVLPLGVLCFGMRPPGGRASRSSACRTPVDVEAPEEYAGTLRKHSAVLGRSTALAGRATEATCALQRLHT